jgi:hypothetical protein
MDVICWKKAQGKSIDEINTTSIEEASAIEVKKFQESGKVQLTNLWSF